ncbi:MAG: DUF4159 domain-containing protein [Myxococcales bacterium]
MLPPLRAELSSQPSSLARSQRRARTVLGVVLACLAVLAGVGPWPSEVAALGPGEGIDVRRVRVGGFDEDPRPKAAQRIAWEVRKRTSIETALEPSVTRFDDPSVFRTPFLYWASDRAFEPMSEKEITGLRRFVEYGGFILIDNASPESSGFDASVRRDLARAFPGERLTRLNPQHTIFRSFYLIDRPVGRVAEPDYLEVITHAGRAAVVYSRHDLGGAWARDENGDAAYAITPGGLAQREQAIRLGVNLVMYALCLDYKDDQVHAPFILRRRGGRP